MINFEALKEELFQVITEKKYKGESVINVFMKDSAFVKQMVKEGKLSQDTLGFLEENVQKITDISAQVSIQFFRNIKYEELLYEYCEKEIKTKVMPAKPSKQVKIEKQFGEITLDTKEWLLDNWETNTHVIVNYLIDETKSEKIVWVESNSGNAFTIVLDGSHVIKLKRSIKNKTISFWLVRKNNGKNQKTAISKSEYDKLYAVIKNIEYVEDELLSTEPIRQTDSHTKEWLISKWGIKLKTLLEYIAEETKAGRMAWVESSTGKELELELDEIRSIKLRRNDYGRKTTCCLIRREGKKSKSEVISKKDFEQLYAIIKGEKEPNSTPVKFANTVPLAKRAGSSKVSVGKVNEKSSSSDKNEVMHIDALMDYLIDETLAGRVEWKEFMDGNTFTAKFGDAKGATLVKSKKKRNYSYQVRIEEFKPTKRTINVAGEFPYRLYDAMQRAKHRKMSNAMAELVKYTQLIFNLDGVRNDASMEVLYKLSIRLQKRDEKCGYPIDKTYKGRISWSQVLQSGLQGDVYIASDDEKNKYVLQCYKESEKTLYRLYKNRELLTNSGIARYLEEAIKDNNCKKTQSVDLSEYILSEILQTLKVEVNAKAAVTNSNVAPVKRKVGIGVKDMVVRRNIFKCMHNKHSIEDVDAVVKVMNKNIEMKEVLVPAGYCKHCRLFFIMESTYQQLIKQGVVAFRSVDEKSYLSQNYLNGNLLAKESILMQFGYSVSKAEGLSEARRHKILSVLVDNHILTKSEIISYLDFFINQRKSDKFAMAVAKWTIDRDYIRNYKIGEYSKIGVIYRNS